MSLHLVRETEIEDAACPKCGRKIPDLSTPGGKTTFGIELHGFEVVSRVYLLRCPCGTEIHERTFFKKI